MSLEKASPWDLFKKSIEHVETVVAAERMEICRTCPSLLPTQQCRECWCIMPLKTKLPHAFCPLGKWDAVQVSYKENQ